MNIDKIKKLIQSDKNKYINQNDNIDLLIKGYDTEKASDTKKILFGLPAGALSLAICVGFSKILTLLFMGGIESILDVETSSLLTAFTMLFIIFNAVLSLALIVVSFFYSYTFLHKFFLKKQLISASHNHQKYKDLLDSLLSPAFEDSIISDSLLTELKLDLSPDEYQCFRLKYKNNITYKQLYNFINDYNSVEMEIDKIKQEQMTIINNESIKAYGKCV